MDKPPFERTRWSDLDEFWPPHDPGPWPAGFTASREEMYDRDEPSGDSLTVRAPRKRGTKRPVSFAAAFRSGKPG